MESHNHKHFILAIALSMLVLFCWQYFYSRPQEEVYRKQQIEYQKQYRQELAAQKQKSELKAQSAQPEAAVSKRIPINTPKISGSIDLKGARLDDLKLLSYKQTKDKDSPPVTLLSPADSKSVYFAEFGWVSTDSHLKLPNADTVWSSENTKLEPLSPLVLTWDNGQNITFEMVISIDDNYLFNVTRRVYNLSKQDIQVTPFGLINRTYRATKEDSQVFNHLGPIMVLDEVLTEVSFSDLQDEKNIPFARSHGWLGFADKYWFSAMIPAQGSSFSSKLSYYYRDLKNRYQIDYVGETIMIPAGGKATDEMLFYAGSKKVGLLDSYAKSHNIPLFDRAVDFGLLYFITKPIFLALTWFHSLVGNFGIAILLLTVCIKTLLYPLAYKSYLSMHQLKQFHPQIIALRERYQDNKILMNKEIMALYKREKINPASGCLPILLQIPIFFALYRVLSITIEMRHAPFFGWIQDLSAPDPTSIFNLFGLLPFEVAPVFQLGVWPIVMGLTMYIQQRISPAPADPIQAKVFKFLPILFTFILYRFPAGLVIYWVCNNTLTIIQQSLITTNVKKKTKAA